MRVLAPKMPRLLHKFSAINNYARRSYFGVPCLSTPTTRGFRITGLFVCLMFLLWFSIVKRRLRSFLVCMRSVFRANSSMVVLYSGWEKGNYISLLLDKGPDGKDGTSLAGDGLHPRRLLQPFETLF